MIYHISHTLNMLSRKLTFIPLQTDLNQFVATGTTKWTPYPVYLGKVLCVCITTGVSPNQNIEVIHTQFVARRYIAL
jgi:hypothetical protein